MRLFLVKHSFPDVRREVSPESWSLSEEGRRRARRVAECLTAQRPTRPVSSKELKAIETAGVIGHRIGHEVELHEGFTSTCSPADGSKTRPVRCVFRFESDERFVFEAHDTDEARPPRGRLGGRQGGDHASVKPEPNRPRVLDVLSSFSVGDSS